MSSAASYPPRLATVADLLAIPEEERFHELLDGEIFEKTAPTFEHGGAQGNVFHLLKPYDRRPGGRWPGGWWFATEVEVYLDEKNIPRPDVAGWRRERVPERPSGSPVPIRPDWICEIISPSKPARDLVKKKRLYHQHQVPHYWIIDPRDETLTVHRWTQDGYTQVLLAERSERVRAEPFDAIELAVGVLFGDDEEE